MLRSLLSRIQAVMNFYLVSQNWNLLEDIPMVRNDPLIIIPGRFDLNVRV